MTSKVALAGLTAVLFAVAAQAADPNVEVFGGYQYFHPDGGPNMNGWNAAVTGNLSPAFGVTADFSGSYGAGFTVQTYTFGPKVSAPTPVVRPFAHALFGPIRLSQGNSSISGFDMMLGGGLDAGRGRLAWRVAQVDWMLTHFSGFTDKKNVRVSTGIVLRF